MLLRKEMLYEEFHKASSIIEPVAISPEEWPIEWRKVYFKGYPRFKRYPLPREAWKEVKGNLSSLLIRRESKRNCSENSFPVTIREISILLLGAAITRPGEDVVWNSRRAYPSAGARYPIEVYLLLINSQALPPAIYHYHVRTHSLEHLWDFSIEDLQYCFPGQEFVRECGVVFLLTSIMSRTVVKYSERGYRFALMESGHLAQNILLLSEAIGRQACPLGGFRDQAIVDLLDLDEGELPLYAISIG